MLFVSSEKGAKWNLRWIGAPPPPERMRVTRRDDDACAQLYVSLLSLRLVGAGGGWWGRGRGCSW